MLIHLRTASAWLARRWIIGVVLLFGLLMTYTSSPIFGQSAAPTPDIQTVPVPAMVATPTNTPFPTATPVAPDIPQVPSPDATALSSVKEDKSSDSEGDTNDTNNPAGDATGGDATAGDTVGGGTTGGGVASGNDQATDAQKPSQTNGALTGKVLITVLNMRKGPSTGNAIIDTLFHNDVVQILARSADSAWWLVCCGNDTKRQGWVSAQFVQPSFNRAQANTLLPIGAGSSAAPPLINTVTKNALAPGVTQALTMTAGARITNTLSLTTSARITPNLAQGSNTTLQFQMRPSPAFVWQGQLVNLQFIVKNLGQTAATNVRLRDDLPDTLHYIQAVVSHDGHFQQSSKTQGGSIVTMDWPQLGAGATLTATLTLRITPDIPNGSLIDNLAVVAADNVSDIETGVTLAMPPTLMPQFK